MQLRRAISLEVNNQTFQEFNSIRHTSIITKNANTRIPRFMQDAIRNSLLRKSMAAEEEQNEIRQSKIRSIIRTKINHMRKIKSCQICECQMKGKKDQEMLFLSNCEHKQSFCESCLHHYAIYKIKTFEEVRCPREDCNALLDTNADFFKQLPADVQRAYRKLHQFYVAAEDPNVKLCPKENCEGLIRTTLQGVMVCDKCEAQFCAKCLLGKHQGECEKQELVFFEQQLHYRQCKKCKFVIEKNQGCNHMTCRCHYQFCYVCGEDWAPQHHNEHDLNGQLIRARVRLQPIFQINNAPVVNENVNPYCQRLKFILQFPIKFVLLMLFLSGMVVLFFLRHFTVIVGSGVVSVVLGVSLFTLQRLMKCKSPWCILGFIFLPFMMIAGILSALNEIFILVLANQSTQCLRMLFEKGMSICNL